MRRLTRLIVALLAAAVFAPFVARAQSFSFGSASPAAAAKDTDTVKPAAGDSTVKHEFKPSWSFSAWLFGTYTYTVDSATKAANGGKAASNFTVDRAYLTFRGQVAPDWGFRITTDVKNMPVPNGYAGLFIRLKYAYMQWDYLHAAEPASFSAWARIGQIHTVILEDEELFWPRWLQKSALEYWGFQPGAADLGASTQLTLPNSLGFAYFTLANGPGYQTAADPDRYKDAALRLSIQPFAKSGGMFKTLQITPWAQVGRTQATLLSKPGLENNAGGLFVGSGDPRLTFGVEYGERQFQTLPVSDIITTTMTVWDGFVQVRPSLFTDPAGVPWGLIVRYDDFKASTDNAAHRTLVLAGVFIDVARYSSFALTYQDDVGHSEIAPIPTKTMWQLNWQITL